MEYISLQQAALMLSDSSRNVHFTTLLYAAHMGLIPCKWQGRLPVIPRPKWEELLMQGIRIPTLAELIKRDLKDSGIWQDEWTNNWDRDEEPLTEEEADDYERSRIVRMAIKPIKRFRNGRNKEQDRYPSIF